MIDRNFLVLVAALLALALAPSSRTTLHAEQNSINHEFLANIIHAQVVAPSGTFTQVREFRSLSKTTTQAVQVQGTGTAPNYRVELLVTLDGTNFAKPELGGDIGTFTDANLHIIPLFSPLSLGHKLKITELGGNAITIEASELSQ